MNSKELEKNFSLPRFLILVKNTLLTLAPGFGIAFSIVIGLNTILLPLTDYRSMLNSMPTESITAIISIVSIFIISSMFKPMHSGRIGTEWLLLPANNIEKYLALVFAYVIIFPIAIILTTSLLSSVFFHLLNALNMINNSFYIWSPFDAGFIKYVFPSFIATATIYVAGSTVFKKQSFLKTTLLIVCVFIAIMLITFLTVKILAKDGTSTSFGIYYNDEQLYFNGIIISSDAVSSLSKIFNVMYYIYGYGLLPIFALVFGFFRVVEKEARDEVQ